MRRLVLLLPLVALGCGDDGGETPVLRPAPRIPSPSEGEKVAYLYRFWAGGAQEALFGAPIPLWHELGEVALVLKGKAALDHLLAEERFAEYRRAPDILANLLRILPHFREAAAHPRLYPFLLHWLDPEHAPPRTPSANWAEDFRRDVFVVFRAFPDERAVPACLAELGRTERVHDLRVPAISVLLATGRAAVLNGIYRELPPNGAEPQTNLRIDLLLALSAMAAPAAGAKGRAQVEELRPLLRQALESPLVVERFNAMGVLLRLGEREMAGRLIEVFEEHRADEPAAWSALLVLAQDGPHPFAREEARRQLAKEGAGVGTGAAATLLMRWWPEESKDLVWKAIGEDRLNPMQELPRLLAADRARAVEFLRGEIGRSEAARVDAALRFIRGERVTELGPAVVERLRALDPAQRPPFYRTLIVLGTPGTEALLLAELARDLPPVVRDAVVTELLNLGGTEGLARLARELAQGDAVVLAALLRRARQGGPGAVPDALLSGVLGALRAMPAEDERRAALLILRYRGTLEGVRAGLVDAYRREPSRRIAGEIGAAIVELAHR